MLIDCNGFVITHYIILLEIRITSDIIQGFDILCLVDPVGGVHLFRVVDSPINALSVLPVHHYGAIRPQPTPLVIPIVRITEFLDHLIYGLVAVKYAPRCQLSRCSEVPASWSQFLACRGIMLLPRDTTAALPGPRVWIDRCAQGLSP